MQNQFHNPRLLQYDRSNSCIDLNHSNRPKCHSHMSGDCQHRLKQLLGLIWPLPFLIFFFKNWLTRKNSEPCFCQFYYLLQRRLIWIDLSKTSNSKKPWRFLATLILFRLKKIKVIAYQNQCFKSVYRRCLVRIVGFKRYFVYLHVFKCVRRTTTVAT